MPVTSIPEIEDPPVRLPETRPRRWRNRWWPWSRSRIGLDLDSDNDQLILHNTTSVAWMLHHGYHRLGPIEPEQDLTLHISKHGTLSALPQTTPDAVEYLVLPLHQRINEIYIYRRTFTRALEVYDMRAVP
ncbi:hypothetical protein KDA_42140 [Dictyobacter alpinus]|uniref:Uncharacterized protein n=1 Tax=Dictyobacter alpinus TaxID=2014873 RepID=A0A402BBR1_9CHLR|nr:hypothetical protein [Dictyobacter alpinus]GCE28730.1 hypothetical protein KDA_42140 [Dictyobacter alpinus]